MKIRAAKSCSIEIISLHSNKTTLINLAIPQFLWKYQMTSPLSPTLMTPLNPFYLFLHLLCFTLFKNTPAKPRSFTFLKD